MAAPTVLAVMQAIETALATISGLRTNDVSPGQITPPCAVVGVPAIPKYHATFARGKMDFDFQVTVLVSAQMDRVGQALLAGYASPTGSSSVIAAIESDKTLGGVVDNCFVESFRPLGLEEVGQIGYFGGVFVLPVITNGS